MFERFTDRVRKVMALANQEAQRCNHEYIGTEHILLGLVKEGSGVGANALKNLKVDLRNVALEVEKIMKPGPDRVTMGRLPQTEPAKNVIQHAIREARSMDHNYVGTEHVLLGLLAEPDIASKVLVSLGVTAEAVRKEICNLLKVGLTKAADPWATVGVPDSLPYSESFRRVLVFAGQEARRCNHDHIGTGHVLLAIVREGTSKAAQVLGLFCLDRIFFRAALDELVPRGDGTGAPGGGMPDSEVAAALNLAADESRALGHAHIGPDHLLLAILRDVQSIAARALAKVNLDPQVVRAEMLRVLVELPLVNCRRQLQAAISALELARKAAFENDKLGLAKDLLDQIYLLQRLLPRAQS